MSAEVLWDKRVEFLSQPNGLDVRLRGTIGLRGVEGHDEVEVFDFTLPKTWLSLLSDTLAAFPIMEKEKKR